MSIEPRLGSLKYTFTVNQLLHQASLSDQILPDFDSLLQFRYIFEISAFILWEQRLRKLILINRNMLHLLFQAREHPLQLLDL